jgi:membrane-bound lytic murein transglycosylase D
LLPYDNASLFAHNLANYKGPLATWTAWVVPKTMRSADAARLVGMSESTLREINHIPPKMLVKAGSALLVPRAQHRTQDVSEAIADNAMMALAPDLPPLKRMTLKAGKRDSVASIAKRYRVSAQQVAQWNKVSAGSSFKRGQTIVVYVNKSNKPASSALAAKRSGTRVAKNTPNVRSKATTRPSSVRNNRVRVASAR